MSYSQPFQVECFYSCDKKLAIDVLTGKEDLKKSTNLWDWLGNGVYFGNKIHLELRNMHMRILMEINLIKSKLKLLLFWEQ